MSKIHSFFMSQKVYLPEKLFDGEKFRKDTAILTDQERVIALLPISEIPENTEVISYSESTIAPAFKDIQIYGGNGQMFSLFPSVETLKATYAYSKAGGVTSFMATIPTSSPKIMQAAIQAVNKYWESGLPGLLGLQLEGPYLNPIKKGAHLEKLIQKPSLDDVKKLITQGQGVIKMMTIAPECCSDAVIRYLAQQDILLSAGHSNATYEEAKRGFDQGITTCTHLFNAMSGLHHRAPGLVGAAFDSSVFSSIIPDGFHVDEAALRIASQLMGDRLFVITDAITEAKTDTYHYIQEGDRIVLADGTLAGSCLSMEKAVRKMIAFGLAPEEALKKVATIPSKVLGKQSTWGKIAPGYIVDWVLLNQEYQVQKTLSVLTSDYK